MTVTKWVLLTIGLIEVITNFLFLVHVVAGKGFAAAKKFHGDFPAFASDRAWISKILISFILGIIAIVSALFIQKGYRSQIIMAGIFSGGMLLMSIVQAVLYGKKHLPSLLSPIIGVFLVALVVFQI